MSLGEAFYKATIARLCNERMSQLPFSSKCRNLRPFKEAQADKQAAFTGKQWREASYISMVLLGLNNSCNPDDDIVFQTALLIDKLVADLFNVNKELSSIHRTKEDISGICDTAEMIADKLMNGLRIRENTKIQRLKYHLQSSLLRFGSLSATDTSENESLHRLLKKAFKATNKQKGN